jgi:hypothetical protein
MGISIGDIRQRLFGISPEEAMFARRRFRQGDADLRQHLERIGKTFIQGYQLALKRDELDDLATELNRIENGLRGFAYEGAGMGLALLDQLLPWGQNRLGKFLDGAGANHLYMLHVGAGWAMARFPWWQKSYLKKLDPLMRWLAIDGYGFHEGYFHWRRYVLEQVRPGRLQASEQHVFDQGLGRSLWFVECADVRRLPQTIASFQESRRDDLWSGVGLACAYAGGVDRAAIEALYSAAGPYKPKLAQGAAFAAKTRQRAGNPTFHTELACEIFCGRSVDAAASLTDIALEHLPFDGPVPAYQIWRQRIQSQLAEETEAA